MLLQKYNFISKVITLFIEKKLKLQKYITQNIKVMKDRERKKNGTMLVGLQIIPVILSCVKE